MTIFVVLGAVCAIVFAFYMRAKHPSWGVWRGLFWFFGAWMVVAGVVILIAVMRGPKVFAAIDDYLEVNHNMEEILGVVDGKDSCFAIIKERNGTTHAFFTEVEGGYISVGSHSRSMKTMEFGIPKLYYNDNTDDHYVSFWVFGPEAVITDSEGSDFEVFCVRPATDKIPTAAYMAVAYVGRKDMDYYNAFYWIQVSSNRKAD